MNGKLDVRTTISVVVVVFQTILVIFGYQIREAVLMNEGRIRALENFAARGDRWTITDHMQYESRVVAEVKEIWEEIAALKVDVAKHSH